MLFMLHASSISSFKFLLFLYPPPSVFLLFNPFLLSLQFLDNVVVQSGIDVEGRRDGGTEVCGKE